MSDTPLELRVAVPPRKRKEAGSLLKRRIGKRGSPEGSVPTQDTSRNMVTTPEPVIFEVDDLKAEEVEMLLNGDAQVAPVPFADDLRAGNVRALHHAIAMAVARDESPIDISRVYGVNPATVKALMDAPAFGELVAQYRANPENTAFGIEQKMMSAAHDAVDLLREKMARSGGDIGPQTLLSISDSFLDRTGHGRTSTHVTKNVGMDHGELKRIKAGPPKSGELSVVEPTGQGDSQGHRPPVGAAADGG